METDPWIRAIDPDGTWLCEHMDETGNPAAPTRLSAAEGQVEAFSTQPVRLHCPDCETLWRVWERLGVAKFYVEYPPQRSPLPPVQTMPDVYRAHLKDMDAIIAGVSQMFPDIKVKQHQYVWPADDECLWWFRLPENADDIQIEGAGMSTFLVETDDQCCANTRRAATIEEAVHLITEHLSGLTG